MNKKLVPVLMITAIMMAACAQIPATGGSTAIDQYGYGVVGGANDLGLPSTGGLPSSSINNPSLSDEAMSLQGLLSGPSVIASNIGFATDITLDQEAIANQNGDLSSLKQ